MHTRTPWLAFFMSSSPAGKSHILQPETALSAHDAPPCTNCLQVWQKPCTSACSLGSFPTGTLDGLVHRCQPDSVGVLRCMPSSRLGRRQPSARPLPVPLPVAHNPRLTQCELLRFVPVFSPLPPQSKFVPHCPPCSRRPMLLQTGGRPSSWASAALDADVHTYSIKGAQSRVSRLSNALQTASVSRTPTSCQLVT